MSSSTAQRQSEADALWNTTPPRRRSTDLPATSPAKTVEPSSSTAGTVAFPDFGPQSSSINAATARLAGRINASNVSEHEIKALLEERQKLVAKMFETPLDRVERARLQYLRWNLDRIEDAKHGWYLDKLEAAISTYEDFAEKLGKFNQKLENSTPRRRKK